MDDDSDIREAAIHFEAVKIAMNQDKNGWVLKLAIHPNDVPSRYTVAMVLMNDQSEPIPGPDTREGSKAVAAAGRLCRNPRFWDYLSSLTAMGYAPINTEENAAEALKFVLDISSRSDLKSDHTARMRWDKLVTEFMKSIQDGDI